MKKIDLTKEKIKLTTRQILLYLVDGAVEFFDIRHPKTRIYRKFVKDYYQWRSVDKIRFNQNLYQLEKSEFIKSYIKNKEKIIQLTVQGEERIKRIILNEVKLNIPKHWDYKWRMVIFDIPEEKKKIRDILARKLKQLGFFPLQKSVYIFPFQCRKEINRIKYLYDVGKYVQYITAERIETEIDLVKYFFDNKSLKESILKNES